MHGIEFMEKSEDIMARIEALEAKVARLTLQEEESPIALIYAEPIATPLARETAAFRYHEKFFSMMDAGEACIKYTAVLAVALLQHHGQSVDLNDYFSQPITLGGWVRLLKDVLTGWQIPDTGIAGELKYSLLKSNGRPTQRNRYLSNEFINLRNQYRGHTSALTEDTYKNLYLQHSPTLHDILFSLSYLKYPMVRTESVIFEANGFSYDVRMLVGPSPIGRIERVHSESKINPGSICIWDENLRELLELGEMIQYCSCPKCNLEHTFFIERYGTNYRDYHTYTGNHRFRQEI
jgi:hypothetical protein